MDHSKSSIACYCILFFLQKSMYEFVFSSPEVKAEVNFSDRNLSVVCRRRRRYRRRRCCCCLRRCCKLFTHIFVFFSRTTGPISTKLGTKHS